MKRKVCQFQNWSNYLSVPNGGRTFTPFRYVRGVAVQLQTVKALALNGGQCSTLHLTISHPGMQHHYPLNMGLSGLERRSRCFVRGENFLPLTAYKPQNTRSVA